jgi:hypothetical protein
VEQKNGVGKMKFHTRLAAAGAALLMSSYFSSVAAAGADYPYAATAYLGAGGKFLTVNDCDPGDTCDIDVLRIVGGADIVLPLSGYWNLQIGGGLEAIRYDHPDGVSQVRLAGEDIDKDVEASAIAFWRDPEMGLLGIEAGITNGRMFTNTGIHAKIGGVFQYYFSDEMALSGHGGAILPFKEDANVVDLGNGNVFTNKDKSGFYAGGELTWYASDTVALSGFGSIVETNTTLRIQNPDSFTDINRARTSVRLGGKVRYLTSAPGIELFAQANYISCEHDQFVTSDNPNVGRQPQSADEDGVEVMVGVSVRLGGKSDSLVAIDRSNAINTRAWNCGA